MKLFHGYANVPDEMRGASLAIGNFDGVHRGHQAVLQAAKAAGDLIGAPLGAVTFAPHPRRYFAPDTPEFRLTADAAKARLLADAGVTRLFVLPFDAELAAVSASAFAQNILAETFGARHVTVGADFQFGARRAGNAAALAEFGAVCGYGVTAVEPQTDSADAAYSSSWARQALRDGDPEAAAAVLGRLHAIEGRVAMGDQRGRTIGFPTANLSLDSVLAPKFGVYAVSVEVVDGPAAGRYGGVANIGMRPTFGKTVPNLEAHIFDFHADIYGCELHVGLQTFLRPERKFDGLDALKHQIAQDSAAARDVMAAAL